MKDGKKLNIRLLDRLEIQFNNQCVESVLNKSKKARMLIEFLILHRGEPVTVYKLYEALWGKVDIRNPESALKALVCRTRSMLTTVDPSLRDCIVADTGVYGWNMEITDDVDVFNVEALCAELTSATAMTDALRKKLDRLLCTYSGNLLPEVSQEDWVMVFAMQLEDAYRKAITHSLELLREEGEWETVVKVCRMSLMVMPLEMEWHEAFMRALIVLNRRNEALTQYRHVTNLHLQQLGVQPPARICDLYTEILRADNTLEKDIGSVSRELEESAETDGAFVCEYAIFKDIYQLQIRSLERYKLSTYLVMLKVSNVLDQPLQPMYLDEVMRKLLEVLKKSLRKGDTITRYTASQYAMLLQGPSLEMVKMIMDRVRLAFYQDLGNSALVMEYRYMPLGNQLPNGQGEAL